MSDQVWTGKALKPAVTVKDGNVTLKKDRDYTVSYSANKGIGTAKVTVTGKGKLHRQDHKDFQDKPTGTEHFCQGRQERKEDSGHSCKAQLKFRLSSVICRQQRL